MPETPPDTQPLSRSQLLDLYYYMRLTRTLEERLISLKAQGRVTSNIYRSLGQEADAVGSAYALDREKGDVLCPLIRNVGSILVQGATPLDVLRNQLARDTSPSRGVELGFNFADLKRGFIGHIANLGVMLPVMAGVALSFKMRGEPRVALVYSGDGATSTGQFHEGINFAAVQRLPLVVVVEYNHYAYSTPNRRQFAVDDVAAKARAYGIPSAIADGNDVLAVYDATRQAVERARAGEGVTLIELKTYRRTGHAQHDDQRYVPEGEVEQWAAGNDPLDRYLTWLRGEPIEVEETDLAAIDARASQEIDAATETCLNELPPWGETSLEQVYSN